MGPRRRPPGSRQHVPEPGRRNSPGRAADRRPDRRGTADLSRAARIPAHPARSRPARLERRSPRPRPRRQHLAGQRRRCKRTGHDARRRGGPRLKAASRRPRPLQVNHPLGGAVHAGQHPEISAESVRRPNAGEPRRGPGWPDTIGCGRQPAASRDSRELHEDGESAAAARKPCADAEPAPPADQAHRNPRTPGPLPPCSLHGRCATVSSPAPESGGDHGTSPSTDRASGPGSPLREHLSGTPGCAAQRSSPIRLAILDAHPSIAS